MRDARREQAGYRAGPSSANEAHSPEAAAAPPRPGVKKAAFEADILPHLDAAFTLARYLTRRADIAEDIVQDALLRAYRSFETSRADNHRAWLLAIVRNCFLTWKAGKGEHRDWEQCEEAQASAACAREMPAEQATPELILLRQEQSHALRAAIEGLPGPFREVLVLRDIEDMSYREIADITGCPVGTVMSRLSRARKLFAEAWKQMHASRGARS